MFRQWRMFNYAPIGKTFDAALHIVIAAAHQICDFERGHDDRPLDQRCDRRLVDQGVGMTYLLICG